MATKAKTKSEITYLDDDYNIVPKAKATLAVIREFGKKGQLVKETWGTWDKEAKGEKRGALVEPKGKSLKPFTKDEVPISEKDIDAAIATWNERMPKEAKGILEARVPTAEEEAQAARDLEEAGEKAGRWRTLPSGRRVQITAPTGGRFGGGGKKPSAESDAGTLLASQFLGEGWEGANEQTRAAMKAEIVKTLADETGLSESMVNEALANWAKTAGDNDEYALRMQGAVAKEFALTQSDYVTKRLEGLGSEVDPRESLALRLFPGKQRARMDETERRQFLRGMYDSTQTQLREAGLSGNDTITLYRGAMFQSPLSGLNVGDLTPISHSAMASWSLSPKIAGYYAGSDRPGWSGIVLKMAVPVSAILSTARTGAGCLPEGEFIVFGVPGTAEIAGLNRTE